MQLSAWKEIGTAPTDGRMVRLGWLPNGRVEMEVTSFWEDGRWNGGWTPTHWKPTLGRPVYPKGVAP